MDISKSQIFLVTSLFLIVLQVIRLYVSKQSPKGLRRVPGPRGWPLVGNSFQLEAHPEEQLRRWAKKYGEVFSLSLGGYNWVFVCSPEAIKEIMDKQSAATSSRIPLPAMGEVVSGGMRTILQQYNPKWRQLRAITHKLLSVKVSDTYRPSQEYEAKQLLHDLLTDNEDCTSFYTHCRRYSTSVVMTSTYGKRVPSWVCVSFSFTSKALSLV
jgi:cytochrome P450